MRTGQVVADRFLLGRLAGRGGMGLVFEAQDQRSGQRVALKLMIVSVDDVDGRRFQREASLLAGLQHPSVVRYVAHGVDGDGCPFLAMEWLDGKPVGRRLAEGPLEVGECVDLGIAIAEGLAAAHAHGIVHRDLKPSNVFLVEDDTHPVRIIDFGIARGPSSHLTATGVIVGTPGYMSPEQARGDQVGPAADVFALGALLFECLTGERAFVGHDLRAETVLVIAPRACELRPSVPEPLDELLAQMLSPEPQRRPGDASIIARELARVRDHFGGQGAPLSLRPAALGERERRISAVVRVRSVPPGAADALGELAKRFGATVESLTGGSWMTSMPQEGAASDRATLAARCALAMRPLVGDAPMAVAVAATPTDVASVRGEAFDLAGQLLAAAQPGQIRLDPTTSGLLLKRFRTKTAFKTRTDDVTLLLGERPWTWQPREVLGKRSPCVGRERQLAALDQTLAESTSRSRAVVALITAPPGIGKSRVAHEALSRAAAREPRLRPWIARGDPVRAYDPFAIVSQLAFGQFPADGSLGFDRDRWLHGWQEMVRAQTSAGPLLILLEDAQWIDPQSLWAIEAAVRAADDCPLMVLAVGRGEPGGGDLWRSEQVARIELRPLSPRASADLARSLLGPAAPEATIERIVTEAAGNPLYIEELARADKLGKQAPPTVVSLLLTELESLDAEARRVARVASVLDEVFRREALDELLGRSMSQFVLKRALARLVAAEVLKRCPPAPDAYAFRSALLREAASAMLTDEDRTRAARLAEDFADTLRR